MEGIRDTIDKFKFDYEKKSYYVDRTTEILLIFNIPPKGELIRVYFKRKRQVPAGMVIDIFSSFPEKNAVKEDSFGLIATFTTLIPAVECYKKMNNHKIFPSVSVSQMLSKRQIETLLNRLNSCGKCLEPAFVTETKLLEEIAFLSKRDKEMERAFLHYSRNTIKPNLKDSTQDKNARQIQNNGFDTKKPKYNNLNHVKALDLKSVPYVNEQRYYPPHKRYTRPYEPTANPIIPKYATPQVFIKHDREWLTPYVLYHLSIFIYDDTKLIKFIRKIKMTEKTDFDRLDTSNSLLQYRETQLHEVLICSEMCCEQLTSYVVRLFPQIYQINHHFRRGIYSTARYILAYVKSSEEASHLADALKQKRFMAHKIYALSISQIEKTYLQN